MVMNVKIQSVKFCVIIGIVISFFNYSAQGQINYSLNCSGGFSCNGNSAGAVSVSIKENQRLSC